MNSIWLYVRIFGQLLYRDIYAFRKQIKSFAINYMLVAPLVYSINYGYLMPNSGMINPTPEAGTIFFLGSLLQVLISPSLGLAFGVFFDTQHTKLLQYQMTFAPLSLIILERIFFFSIVTFVFIGPYYVIAKWLLGSYLATAHAQWWLIMLVMYLGMLFFSAFSLFFIFYIEGVHQVGNLFDRFIFPMLQLGGLRMPFSVFLEYSLVLGILVAFNPMMHLTEALRKAMLGGDTFMPYYVSITGILFASALFAFLAIRYAYKRLDAV
ncbi:MAG: hypothetical protein AB7F19_01130 [Candidatus Babeliales bacterium]